MSAAPTRDRATRSSRRKSAAVHAEVDCRQVGWPDENQRDLRTHLSRLRALLEQPAADATGEDHKAAPGTAPAASRAPTALKTVCRLFALSSFERDILLLCAGAELEAGFGASIAAQQGSHGSLPTFGLALETLPEAHWSALAPDSPLRHWRLVELEPGETLAASPLRIDERILHYLTGLTGFDRRLEAVLKPVPQADEHTPSQLAVVSAVRAAWSGDGQALALPIHLYGDPQAALQIAAAGCSAVGRQMLAVDADDIPAAPADRYLLALLCEREALLAGAALTVLIHDNDGADQQRSVERFAESVGSGLIVISRDPLRAWKRPMLRLEAPASTTAERVALWKREVGFETPEMNRRLARVASHFVMGAHEIRLASRAALEGRSPLQTTDAEIEGLLWQTCRRQARGSLDQLAQRIEARATWADLILPEFQTAQLCEIVASVRHSAQVGDEWGFASRGAQGLGIAALFSGPSGTGKTLAAEVMSNELNLDLYRIDLSRVVSKYIGETEKNLSRIFAAAEASGAILLFDEADALFGKRSEVKDSHDRYANIEVSYLLQRMESYRGLAILTTNQQSALDAAFLRRLRFAVAFPFPDPHHRALIWRRAFPPQAPTEGLDYAKLARLSVPGGNICSIALRAAFLAADAGEPIRMIHCLRAARGEYAKLEKPMTETEIGGWI